MFLHRPSITSLLLLVCIAIPAGVRADVPSARDVVERFQANLIEVMKEAENLTIRQRYERLAPSVENSFHVPLMIQIAVGGYWKNATTAERMDLVKAFRRMSVTTLATLFDSYSGEVFKHVGDQPGPQNTLLVRTELIKSDKSTVDIAYVSRQFDDSWRIIDVIIDNGISELAVRRSEYNLVLKEKGVPGLVGLLNRKADELMAE